MDLDNVLKQVDPHWHADFRSFEQSGIMSEEFAEHVNSDIFCRAAITSVIAFKYRILNDWARARIMRPLLAAINKQLHPDVMQYMDTGEYTRELVAYLHRNPRAFEAIGRYDLSLKQLSQDEDSEGVVQEHLSWAEMASNDMVKFNKRLLDEDAGI